MRRTRGILLLLIATALPVGAIASRSAGNVAGRRGGPAVAGEPRPRLDTLAGPAATERLAADAARDLASLPGWEMLVEPGSGHPIRAFGPGVPAESGVARVDALAFLKAHPGLIGFQVGDGVHELVARDPVRAGPVTVVAFEQRWHGVPVEGARADVRFAGGRVVMTRLHLARSVDVAGTPRLGRDEARHRGRDAARELGYAPGNARVDEGRPLAIVRGGDGWRLAWAVRMEQSDPPAKLTVWVDASDGTIVAVRDEVRRADTAVTVQAWHEPRRAGDPLQLSALPFFTLSDGQESFVTDSAGLAIVPVSGSSRTVESVLQGPFVRVVAAQGTSASAVEVFDGVPAALTWDDAAASLSERDAALSHAVVRRRMKQLAPDLALLDERATVRVDTPGSGCNAFWTGSGAEFQQESDECNATARVADVVYHEFGHGFHMGLAPGGLTPADVGEGSADYLAATITGDPDIGPSFFKATPGGLRNLEPDVVFPDDVTDEPHFDGLIWGGALWDLRSALIATLGTADGVATADRIFTETLRFDPVLEDGFYDVLLAADDDGNLANGGPFECHVVGAFGPHGLGPGEGLAVSHRPLGQQSPDAPGYEVRAHIASAFPRCGSTEVGAARVEWRLVGTEAWSSLPLERDLVPGWYVATLPPFEEGDRVEYRLRAWDGDGRAATAPARHPDEEPFRFPVGAGNVMFEDDFESDLGWTHELVDGPDALGADDWQRGTPQGRGGDPTAAFSGTHVWGNDLGNDVFNGQYQPGIRNRLVSPVIDCRRCAGTRLQFRRWLGVEEAIGGDQGDLATVWVDGHRVWSNPAGWRLRDQEWRFEDLDISRYADGKRFRIRFELKSDAGVQLGGWNVDDVRVIGGFDPGCGCALGGRPPRGGWVAPCIVAVFLARRRRRA